MGWTYTDLFGVKHYTIEGINYLAQQVMNAFGYVTLARVTFTTSATLNNPNEVLFNTTDNSYYKWTGSFADGEKVVPQDSTPASTGGIGPGKWLSVGDAALRTDLLNENQDSGDALVMTKNTRWGGIGRTQHDVNLQVVSQKDYGAKLDGVTDDTAAIQAAIDALAYNTFINDTLIPRTNREYSTYVLEGSPGIALVSAPIEIYGGVGLRNITLRASSTNTFSVQAVLKSKSDTRMWGRFENITIDGNHQDCRGVFIDNGVGAFWDGIIIVKTLRDAFKCTDGILLNNFAF